MASGATPKPVVWSITRVGLVLAACWALIAKLDPFDLGTVTALASRDVFYRAWSVTYPANPEAKIAVALLTDEDLGLTGVWPPTYARHASLLSAVRRHKPKAVFIDYIFVDRRPDPSLASLIEALEGYARSGIPVFLARPAAEQGTPKPLLPELEALVTSRAVFPVDVRRGTQGGDLETYDISAKPGRDPSAAPAIHDKLCALQLVSANCGTRPSIPQFEVFWAAPPQNPDCGRMGRGDCVHTASSGLLRLVNLAVLGVVAKISPNLWFRETDPLPGAYHPSLSWAAVTGSNQTEDVASLLRDSVVFYGGSFSFASDEVPNPVYGDRVRRLPGVYQHAMAYDNLVTLGPAITRTENPWGISDGMNFAIVLALAFPFLVGARILLDWLGQIAWVSFANYLLLISIAVGWSWYSHAILHCTPANWLGALVAAMLAQIASPTFDKLIERFAGAKPRGKRA